MGNKKEPPKPFVQKAKTYFFDSFGSQGHVRIGVEFETFVTRKDCDKELRRFCLDFLRALLGLDE